MSETKKATHTPGPWSVVVPKKPLHNAFTHAINSSYHAIAWVLPPNDDMPTAEANARLIAAAPDLLAALQTLLDAHDAEPPMLTQVEWDAAREALAKAKSQ